MTGMRAKEVWAAPRPCPPWAGQALPASSVPVGWDAQATVGAEQPFQPTDEGYGLRVLEQRERRKLDPLVMEPSYQPCTTVPDF